MPIEIHSRGSDNYRFFSVLKNGFRIKVRTANGANLVLTTTPENTFPKIEIFIGNEKCYMHHHTSSEIEEPVDTIIIPNIVCADEFREFRINWTDEGILTIGRAKDKEAFMKYKNPKLHAINFVGILSLRDSTTSWIIEDSHNPAPGYQQEYGPSGWLTKTTPRNAGCWISARAGQVPPDAVEGGYDGATLYVARAMHEGALTPGKLLPTHKVIYLPWGGEEHQYREYEVLCGATGRWVSASNGVLPQGAIPAGKSENGELLYIGRVEHNNEVLTCGKVQPSHHCCYVSYGGVEHAYREYEMFIPD